MRKIKIYHGDGSFTEIKKPKEGSSSALNKRTKGEKIVYAIVAVVLAVHIASLFYPWIWMILSSLKESFEYSNGNTFALPKKWLFSNYIMAFKMLKVGETTFGGMIWNSLWYVVINAFLDTVVPSTTAYCISKYRFKGRDLLYSISIFCLTIPIIGGTASAMKLMMDLGLFDNPLYVVVTSMNGFVTGSFLIYYGTYKGISWSYAEAAMMDGAGPFTIYFRIMIPQAMPVLTMYAITGAMGSWSDYMVFITWMPSYPNLATGLYQYKSDMIRMVNWPVYFAGAFISMIPPIILFCAFSSKMMINLNIGGLKG